MVIRFVTREREREGERPDSYNFDNHPILLLAIVYLTLCLIHKLHFTPGVHTQEKSQCISGSLPFEVSGIHCGGDSWDASPVDKGSYGTCFCRVLSPTACSPSPLVSYKHLRGAHLKKKGLVFCPQTCFSHKRFSHSGQRHLSSRVTLSEKTPLTVNVNVK